MYATPSKEDLDRKLRRMVHDYRTKAEGVSHGLMQTARSGHPNAIGIHAMMTAAIDKMHIEAIERAQLLIQDFVERLDLAPATVIAFARPRFTDLANALLYAIPEAGNKDAQARAQGQYLTNFETRVNEAMRDLEIGFVGDRTVTTREESSERRALALLKAIYDKTRDTSEPVFVSNLSRETGLGLPDLEAGWRYLRDKGLIQTFSIAGTARINAAGVDQVERAARTPAAPLAGFPAINQTVNNVTHIGTAINSPVTQAGHHANQTVNASYSANERADLERLVTAFTDHLAELNLAPGEHKKAAAQLQTIQAQLFDEPDPVIVRQAGKTLRNITEGAIAGLIAAAAQPTVWHWIAVLSATYFG